MFGFFKKKRPADPPTDKQLRYAKKLGITVTRSMGKDDVSAAISAAERANPRLAADRERVKTKAREFKFGPELIAEEARWDHFADSTEYMLAIYRRGKEIVVDVLRVNEAFIDNRGKLRLSVEAPKVVKDQDIGDLLDWDEHFELLREELLHFEPLHAGFHADGNDAYRQTVERGLKLARKLKAV
jgi:hypothetical protein